MIFADSAIFVFPYLGGAALRAMATNEGWPEAFGFSMSYGAPCIIDWVEDGGSAEESGLQVKYIWMYGNRVYKKIATQFVESLPINSIISYLSVVLGYYISVHIIYIIGW